MPATSKIVLGTVQFGLNYGINNTSGKPNRETVNSILDFAFDNNIRLLDTAEAYGDAQEVIGAYHKQSNKRFDVITKFSSKRDDLPASLVERVIGDLETLRVSSLYCYMFHSYSDFTMYFPDYRNDIAILKASRKIDKLGVSVYTNSEIDQLIDVEEIDLIQLPFNLLDNNNKRSGSINKAKERGIEIHTRSAFLQGLFFKEANELNGPLIELRPYVREVQNIAERYKIGIADLSLNFAIQQQDIDCVLIGVDSLAQLKQNVKSLSSRISAQMMAEIDLISVENSELLNPSNWKN
jgi:aryl-alcohol dehydrogenase-like predicted oxidoreductase